MGFFDLFKQSNINQGIEEYKRTDDAVLLMYVHRRNIRKDIYQKVKMCRCSNLTILLL